MPIGFTPEVNAMLDRMGVPRKATRVVIELEAGKPAMITVTAMMTGEQMAELGGQLQHSEVRANSCR